MWGNNGGGGSGYVEDGLIVDYENTANLWQATGFRETSLALTDLTAEICCTITGVNASTKAGRILVIKPLYVGVLTIPEYVEPGFDYSFQAFYNSGTPGIAPTLGLNFGDLHTFAVTQTNSVTALYIDGTYIDEFASVNTLSWQYLYIMCSDNSAHLPYGTWNHARIYNRALTTSELLANHAEDVRRYG